MTARTEDRQGQDGAAPAAAEVPCKGCQGQSTAMDRIMGGLAIGFAAIVLLIGLDLATGGRLSRKFGPGNDGS